MKNLITMGAILLTTAIIEPTIAQTTWNIDKSHSKVKFSVTHMMISETTGEFKVYDGKVSSTKDDFTDAKIEFTIDVNSINTDDEKRDAHLKSNDFFNAEAYPKMTFKSTSFKKVNGKNYKLAGDLTIRDVTKKVEFDVIYNGTAKSPWGATVSGFKLNGKINRMDYNLKWNVALEAGGMLVGEEVSIECNVELIKQ